VLGSTSYDITDRPLVMAICNRTPDSFFDQGSYYDFDIRSDGEWEFVKHQAGTLTRLQGDTFSSAILQGVGATNVLKVVMSGVTFACYVNNMLVAQLIDTTFASGDVGVFSGPDEAVFTNYLVTQP